MVGLCFLAQYYRTIWIATVNSQAKENVIEVNTRTFDDYVTSSNRNTFILFYLPDCPHCRKFKPTWRRLAKMLRNEKLNIVQIDAANNEWPESLYKVEGFPTMYWQYAGGGQPTQYTGDRTLEGLMKFVAQQMELNEFDSEGNRK